jgi:uncharacterized protein (TIGR01440 family)
MRIKYGGLLMNIEKIVQDSKSAVEELLKIINLVKGDIFVLGGSTSEITGNKIGTASNPKLGEKIISSILPIFQKNKLFLAVQCCEHLNRALVVEQECALKYNLEVVNAVPHKKAGGSLATAAYKLFEKPVLVESISGHAGIDIGDTLIGMHLKHVVVPVRIDIKKIGEANLTLARTRPKLIGGERAKYTEHSKHLN